MNITDKDDVIDFPSDIWGSIYNHQSELMNKYRNIEEQNGFKEIEIPIRINDPFAQAKIKDFFWRTTEELMEAKEAFNNDEDLHFKEELADALHFLTEAYVMMDLRDQYPIGIRQAENFSHLNFESISELFLYPIYHMGLAANCLKNKPWKSTHVPTDIQKFISHLNDAMESLINLFDRCTEKEVYNLYFKKNQVNQDRIKSNY